MYINPFQTFNTQQAYTFKVGGAVPVWKSIESKIMSGGLLQNPVVGVYPAGTPVYIDTNAHTATVLNAYVVNAPVLVTDTTVQITVVGETLPDGTFNPSSPRINSSTILMVAPSAYNATGTAVAVGTVTQGSTYDTFTITAGALGALAAGTILVEAASAGSNKLMAVTPNALLENDIYFNAYSVSATATGVYEGDIYAQRIAWPVPACVQNALTQIFFDQSN